MPRTPPAGNGPILKLVDYILYFDLSLIIAEEDQSVNIKM